MTTQTLPEQGAVDALGRTYHTIIGYADDITIPLGSLVTLLPAPYSSSRCYEYYNGVQGLVVRRMKDPKGWRETDYRIVVRKLDDLSDWEPSTNFIGWSEAHARVDRVGNNEMPVAGQDYPLCKKEHFDAKWAVTDHRHQGWSNPPTFLAHLGLRTTQKHYRAIEAMVRKNGSINPERLRNYWQRYGETKMPDWAKYPEGFPESLCYLYRIDWPEIAEEFSTHFAEGRRHAAALCA